MERLHDGRHTGAEMVSALVGAHKALNQKPYAQQKKVIRQNVK